MQINSFYSLTPFRGGLHPSLEKYIDAQRGIILEEEANKCVSGYTFQNLKKIEETSKKTQGILCNFREKAQKMGKNTVIGIENRSKYGSGIRGEYWLFVSNRKIPKDIFSTEPAEKAGEEIKMPLDTNGMSKWQINSSEAKITPEEILDRLEIMSEAIEPKATEVKLLKRGRESIENKITSAIKRKGDKKISRNESSRMLKYAKAYQQAKGEVAGKEKAKEKSLVKWVKDSIKKHNKSVQNINLEV